MSVCSEQSSPIEDGWKSESAADLPFCFGCEFEVMIRPKTTSGLPLPPDAASVSQQRRFNFRLLDSIARVMIGIGLESAVFDAAEQEKPDYSKWNMMLDGSLSKRHISDGFYPVEIVSPVLVADAMWAKKIDLLWSTLHQYFEFRKDTSCGFHVHISFREGHYTIGQLRNVAKAVAF
ncbi:putative amidoligase enzyme-domain-containing protein [Hypoxylon sp. FL0890]|nr:putative amidoligase enzyme-domain-containing protein [Hypoxylon sp. FL0890]